MKLSPLTASGLSANVRYADGEQLEPVTAPPSQVIKYRCHCCRDLHDDETDAEGCCSTERVYVDEKVGGEFDSDSPCCPVCAGRCEDTYDAANCCLWKDIDVVGRFRIATDVERGESWAKAIAREVA